jgi:hypothetical protein
VTSSTSYTWSRALGDNDTDGAITYIDPNRRSLNKALLGFHRTQMLTTSGTYELPLGRNHTFLSNVSPLIERFVERWQLGGILNWSSGTPLNVTAPISTITQATAVTTPNLVADFPKSMGQVTKVANGVTYFPGLQQITDPAVSSVSPLNALNGAYSNKAITDATGKLVLVNPQPGQIGTLGLKWVDGPRFAQFDINLIKRVKLTETEEFEFRLDAINLLNHPNFDNPNLNIDNTGFGRITSSTPPNRRFVVNARVNF